MFWNLWKRFTSTVSEIRDWPIRHPIEALFIVAVSIAGAAVSPVAGLAVGVGLAVGGTYMGVTKNMAEKGQAEQQVINADLWREQTASLGEQQRINVVNSQLRAANLQNQQTIARQLETITNLQTNKIRDTTAVLISQATAKVSETGMFTRPATKSRESAPCESNDSNNFEAKI